MQVCRIVALRYGGCVVLKARIEFARVQHLETGAGVAALSSRGNTEGSFDRRVRRICGSNDMRDGNAATVVCECGELLYSV